LKGLSSNINYWLQTHPGASLNDFKNEMQKYDLDENDIKRATGKTSAELFTGPITSVYNPAEGASGATGAGAIGGGTVVNPNGTITTSPVIPGIPVGGFTGMRDVRDAYTAGGGSLGYVNRHPVDPADFEARFNKQTGDSLAAYNYLMGKGANPVKSGVGEIMRPYGEAVRGIPAAEGRPTQKFIYQNGRYVENPNYRPLSYNSKGERIVGLTSTEVLKGLQGLADPTDDVATLDWMTTNNVTVAQLAAALNIPFAEALARYNAAKAKKAGIAATDVGGAGGVGGAGDAGDAAGGGGEAASNNAPVESMGGDTGFGGDGANAGVAGGGNAAGGPGNSGDGGTGDSSTAVGDGFGGGSDGTAGGGGDTGDAPGSDGTPGSGAARGGLLPRRMALGGLGALAKGGQAGYNLGGYSDGGRLLKGPGDGVSDSIPATIGNRQPARLADGEFVVPARIVSELGNGSTEAGARKLYAMMDRVQKARGKTTGKNRVAANTRSDKYLPA
jgi:hypothetical protein